MCQGLPGSGKSTWANGEADLAYHDASRTPVFVVNKDKIRIELAGEWTKKLETEVLKIRDQRILDYFRYYADVTVISDDTNLSRQHRVRLRELATISGATFETKRFDTPLEECIRRVRARTTQPQVPEQAIRDMTARFHWGQPIAYPPTVPVPYDDPADGLPLPPVIICDLDGTLCLMNGRNPYDASTADQDVCNKPVRTLLEVYYRFMHTDIVYLSGREDKYRPQTDAFMRKNHCPPGRILMRTSGDMRKDWIVKGELFDAHIRGRYAVQFVLDDRNQVVNYWRHLGLPCFQVTPGDF